MFVVLVVMVLAIVAVVTVSGPGYDATFKKSSSLRQSSNLSTGLSSSKNGSVFLTY